MGGAIPIHISMLIYAIFVKVVSVNEVDCPKLDTSTVGADQNKMDSFKDVTNMIIVDAACVILFMWKKALSKSQKEGKNIYFKVAL